MSYEYNATGSSSWLSPFVPELQKCELYFSNDPHRWSIYNLKKKHELNNTLQFFTKDEKKKSPT